MEWRLLENIPYDLDEADFLARMSIKPGAALAASCQELISQALAAARPRAVYVPQRIDSLDETGMTAGGARFNSELFKPRLKAGEEIYFFLASGGLGICEWSGGFKGDLLKSYWADCLAEQALRLALAALEEELRLFIKDEYLAAFNPGSLAAWPLTEQRPLFSLMGDAATACGVSLNEHCVMQPQKTVSGFYFSSATEYYNCELCPRLRCPNRRAAFCASR